MMPHRLALAKRELRSFMADTRSLHGRQHPAETCALAKVREALALVEEAELYMATKLKPPTQQENAYELERRSYRSD